MADYPGNSSPRVDLTKRQGGSPPALPPSSPPCTAPSPAATGHCERTSSGDSGCSRLGSDP